MPCDENGPPVGSYEWFAADPKRAKAARVTLPPLPPLASARALTDAGWECVRGVWLSPQQAQQAWIKREWPE
jgi:hypothetical protein